MVHGNEDHEPQADAARHAEHARTRDRVAEHVLVQHTAHSQHLCADKRDANDRSAPRNSPIAGDVLANPLIRMRRELMRDARQRVVCLLEEHRAHLKRRVHIVALAVRIQVARRAHDAQRKKRQDNGGDDADEHLG